VAAKEPLHGCEIWTLKEKERRQKAAGMKFMTRTAGYCLLDHKRNEDTVKELKEEA
jgi:hypothetical protein